MVLRAAGFSSFWGKNDSSLLVNRNQWRWRENDRERERKRRRDSEKSEGERGRERGTPPTKLFRLGRLCGLFTNRTRFSNPGSPNLTSKQQGTLDGEIGREQAPKRNNKKLCVIFLACVHTKAPSPLPSSLPTTTTTSTPVCRIIWTIHFFAGGVTFPGRRKKAGAPPPLLQQLLLPPPPLPSTLLSHLCCSFFAFLFFQLPFTVARRWSQSLGLCCCSVCLSQSLRTQLDALRERGAALHYSIWKLWAVRQRQAVARCVQDREPCFSTGSPGITSKESWRKWREGRKRSRDWRRACSSTGESR